MCNVKGKYFKTNKRGKFLFLCTVDRILVSVSETLRDEYRHCEQLIKISWFSETNRFIVCQLSVFTEK